MTTPRSAKRRGMKTQTNIANYLRDHGWPYATDTGAGRQGTDILGTPDIAIEVKARRDLNPTNWIKQAETNADGRLPLVVFRSHGQGDDASKYLALLRLSDLVELLHAAGYGDPNPDTPGGVA